MKPDTLAQTVQSQHIPIHKNIQYSDSMLKGMD